MLEEGRRGDDNNSNENCDAGDDEDQVHDIIEMIIIYTADRLYDQQHHRQCYKERKRKETLTANDRKSVTCLRKLMI